MKRVGVEEIVDLQRRTAVIRNVCVLAHIDHGKTTLTDSLISSNGIISPRLAGKLRFLDSTEDEQQRGITMHSSAISLLFKLDEKTQSSSSDYLINLIDSPGHIDFSSDVSTATRLCDGALIVIDVLEGICTQTHAVVYKALKEGLVPCLVLNKLDRLCLELQLTTSEAFYHIRRILENINALTYTLVNSERQVEDNNDIDFTALEEIWNFAPGKGNVIFASAFDTWGFGLAKIINIWSKKLGLNKSVLQKYMFEDYSFNASNNKISRCDAADASARPMFAQMVLDPIWRAYDSCVTMGKVEEAVAWFAAQFGVEISPRDVNIRDGRATIRALLHSWLPLADVVLRMVVRIVPSPVDAQSAKINKLLYDPTKALTSKAALKFEREYGLSILDRMSKIVRSISCCSNDGNVVVFVSKMVPVRVSELRVEDIAMLNRGLKRKDSSAIELDVVSGEVMMALGRVFSGTVRKDVKLLSLSHRHDPAGNISDCANAVNSLDEAQPPDFMLASCTPMIVDHIGVYLCFGPSILPVDEVPAGNIIGIIGISDYILKTATLSSSWLCPSLKAMTFQAKPIVRVAIEPVNYYDLGKIEKGLNMLYQYDPAVEIGIDVATGQQTMACLGEIHQEQCVKYLVEKFARCDVKVSEPIVPFRETIMSSQGIFKFYLTQPWKDMVDAAFSSVSGKYCLHTSQVSINLRCIPLSDDCLSIFNEYPLLKSVFASSCATKYLNNNSLQEVINSSGAAHLVECIALMMDIHGDNIQDEVMRRLENVGPNIGDAANLCMLSKDFVIHIWKGDTLGDHIASTHSDASFSITNLADRELISSVLSKVHSAVAAGFQLCCSAGPLMAEPLHGVCFLVENLHLSESSFALSAEDSGALFSSCNDRVANICRNLSFNINTGQLISDLRDAFRAVYLTCPLRLLEPMYECNLQCDQMQLGNLYSVVSRRRGQVLSEDIIEGTSLFVLAVSLPIIESFGFSQELLKQTSGSATTPLLIFSHFQILDVDPFWKPTTEDEIEEFGDMIHSHNLPRQIIDKIRKRKGLAVEEKIVEYAEKQRTLNKKK